MPKIITYTAITNAKDAPRDDIQVFSDFNKFVSPVMNAKIYKILPHKFLDCDISIWLDGNIFLKVPQEKLVEDFLGDSDLALFNHNHSSQLGYEVRWIKYALRHRVNKKELLKEIDDQVDYYTKQGLTNRMKMVMGGMLIRRHTPLVTQFNEAWWAEVCQWSQRDQISLPAILARFTNLKVNYIKGNIKGHPYLQYQTHSHFDT